MRRIFITLSLASAALVGRPLSAQVRSQIPSGYSIPSGMCQVWIDGVAPNRQPRPTDCATAFRTHPANSRVIALQQGNANGTSVRDQRDYRLQSGGNANKNGNYKNGQYKNGKKNGHYKNGQSNNSNNQNGSYRNNDGDADDGNYQNGAYNQNGNNQNGAYRNDDGDADDRSSGNGSYQNGSSQSGNNRSRDARSSNGRVKGQRSGGRQ